MSYVYYIRALAVLEIFLTISVRLIHFQQQPRPPHLLRRVEAAAVASVTELVAGGNTAVVLIVM